MTEGILSFGFSLVISFSLTPVARYLAFKFGIVDQPGERKIHRDPVPLLGGMAICLASLVSIVCFSESSGGWEVPVIVLGATVLMAVGFLDDREILHHQFKLMVMMPLAASMVMMSGVGADSLFPFPFSLGMDFLWIVGVTASFSILDHMDGLCSGIAAVALALIVVFLIMNDQMSLVVLATAILGASLGFLYWNFNPAKIFMGDGGAMFLGFMLATLSLELNSPTLPAINNWIIRILILGIPIFDTTLVTISRIRQGLVPFSSPGKDHTAHRLCALGMRQRTAMLTLCFVGLLLGLLALIVVRIDVWQLGMLGAGLVVGAILAIITLEKAPYER